MRNIYLITENNNRNNTQVFLSNEANVNRNAQTTYRLHRRK